MSRYTIPDLISEIRRQSSMRNATRPCLLLSDLLPLCDVLEAAEQQRDEALSRLKSAEFWQGIYPEGWTAERVENEMTDFLALMDGIPSLYMHITGGRVSKELTDKSVIKSLHDDYVTELVEEATKELEQQRDELQRLNDLLFQDAYSVYTAACESAGHDPEPMEVWQQKYLRVIDRQTRAKGCTA